MRKSLKFAKYFTLIPLGLLLSTQDNFFILFRSLNDFKEEEVDAPESIIRMRFEHYDQRRKVKLKQIQDFILALNHKRKGIISGSLT